MSQKKAHEVHMMSECIKSLALPLEITQVSILSMQSFIAI